MYFSKIAKSQNGQIDRKSVDSDPRTTLTRFSSLVLWVKEGQSKLWSAADIIALSGLFFYLGHSMEMSTNKNCRSDIVFDSLLRSLSILLLTAIGAKLIGPPDGLQVNKQAIERDSRYVEWPTLKIYSLFL